ncbi:unnamed protein product [Ixodes pacificus]
MQCWAGPTVLCFNRELQAFDGRNELCVYTVCIELGCRGNSIYINCCCKAFLKKCAFLRCSSVPFLSNRNVSGTMREPGMAAPFVKFEALMWPEKPQSHELDNLCSL